jgi:hypothetical protein
MFITEPIPGTRDRLAFGLEWRAFATKGSSDERRRYSRDLFATHYTEYKDGSETVCGFGRPAKIKLRTRLFSAAARIAMLDRVKSATAVLVLIEHEGRVFLVFVVRGAVRLDEVVSPEQAAIKRHEIETECERNEWQLTVLGRGPIAGDTVGKFALSELKSDAKIGQIKSLPMQIPAVFSIAIGAIAFVLVARSLVNWLSPPPPPPPRAPSYLDQYNVALRKALSSHAYLASTVAPDVLRQVGAIDTNRKGFQFSSASCDALGVCRVTWKRQGGTFDDFTSAALPEWRPIIYGADGNTLSTSGPSARDTALVKIDPRQKWLTWEELKRTLLVPAQRLSKSPDRIDSYGYKVTLHDPTNLLGGPPPSKEANHKYVRIGTWQIDGFKWQMKLLEQLPSNMAIDSITIELRVGSVKGAQVGDLADRGVHFHAEGKFYVI